MRSDRTSADADLSSKLRKREKAIFDLKRAEDGLETLQLKAPTDGVVNVLPNYRSGNMMGAAPEFRAGRSRLGRRRDPRAARPVVGPSPGAARRVRSQPAQGRPGRRRPHRGGAGQRLQGQDRPHLDARARRLSGTWPPPRNFDLDLVLDRHRPADPPGHDGRRAHRDRARAERRAASRPKRSSSATARPSSTSSTARSSKSAACRSRSAARSRRSSRRESSPAIASRPGVPRRR